MRVATQHSEDLFMVGMGNDCEYESASVVRVLGESFVGYAAACIVFALHLCASPARACCSGGALLAHGRPLKLQRFHPDDIESQLIGTDCHRRRACCLSVPVNINPKW
jgi:hypothetical protein